MTRLQFITPRIAKKSEPDIDLFDVTRLGHDFHFASLQFGNISIDIVATKTGVMPTFDFEMCF